MNRNIAESIGVRVGQNHRCAFVEALTLVKSINNNLQMRQIHNRDSFKDMPILWFKGYLRLGIAPIH